VETRLQHDREKDCSHSCSQTASQTPRARFRLAKGAFAQRWGEHGEHRQIVFPFPGSRPNPVPGREHGTRAVASEPGLYTGNTALEHGAGVFPVFRVHVVKFILFSWTGSLFESLSSNCGLFESLSSNCGLFESLSSERYTHSVYRTLQSFCVPYSRSDSPHSEESCPATVTIKELLRDTYTFDDNIP
jgi:hypothetical protein